MKKWILLPIIMFISGCSSTNGVDSFSLDKNGSELNDIAIHLPNYGPAPELNNEIWLNTEQSLRLADLRGNVVLLDMWTFG